METNNMKIVKIELAKMLLIPSKRFKARTVTTSEKDRAA